MPPNAGMFLPPFRCGLRGALYRQDQSIADERVSYVMRASEFIDDRRPRIMTHASRADQVSVTCPTSVVPVACITCIVLSLAAKISLLSLSCRLNETCATGRAKRSRSSARVTRLSSRDRNAECGAAFN